MSFWGESATLIEGRPGEFSNLTFPLALIFMIIFHFGGSYDVAPNIEEQENKIFRSVRSALSAASVFVPVRENAAGLQSASVVSPSEHSAN
jgi:hypothetical protein